jgi:DnaK suppressor protein
MDVERSRQLLEAERTRLQGVKAAADRLTGQAMEAAGSELSHVDQHPADMGSEVEEREKDLAVLMRLENEMAEVEAALERIDAGRFGICEACGQPIPDARLEAKPAARYCVTDQQRLEKQAAGY